MHSITLPGALKYDPDVTFTWKHINEEYEEVKENMLIHIQAKVQFKCKLCPTESDCLLELIKHLKSSHIHQADLDEERSKDSCISDNFDTENKIDETETKSKDTLTNYLKENKLKKALTCVLCNLKSPTATDCIKHYGEVHGRLLKDKIKNAAKRSNINNLKTVPLQSNNSCSRTEKNSSRCPICLKYFLNENLDFHISAMHFYNQELKNRKNKHSCLCSICGKNFKYASSLIYHNKTAHLDKAIKEKKKETTEYLCEKCSFKTTSYRRLQDHIQAKHENSMTYGCNNCEFKTWELSTIRDHIYKHLDVKRYSCKYCSYQCIQKKQLHRHLIKHGIKLLKKKNANEKVKSDDCILVNEHFTVNNVIAKDYYYVNKKSSSSGVEPQTDNSEETVNLDNVSEAPSNLVIKDIPSTSDTISRHSDMDCTENDFSFVEYTDDIESIIPLNSGLK